MSFKIINTKTKQITVLTVLAISLVGVLSTLLVKISTKNVSAQINYTQYDLRYKENMAGNITITGNSSGLSLTRPKAQEFGLRDFDSIDVFTTLDQSLQEPGYPKGTTRDWKKNSSNAFLNIPEGSKIKYAVLIWGGNYYWEDNTSRKVDQNQQINDPIEIVTPKGSAQVTPSPQYQYLIHQEVNDYKRWYYTNTADITPLITQGQSGSYAIKGIPSILSRNPIKSTEPDNIAGWSIAVAYQNDKDSVKNLTIFTGSQQSNAAPVTISGFGTPPNGAVKGSVWINAMEGDGGLTGDQMKFGENINTLQPLKTNNNLENNFFSSQINNSQGNIDSTGSFGTFNSKNSSSDPLSRQSWDITTVNISDKLKNNQRTASLQGTSNNDNYVINLVAMGIEIYAPRIIPVITVDKPVTKTGEKLRYTVTTTNTGTNKADNMILSSQIPEGTSFVDGSLTSAQSFVGNNPASLNFGTLEIGGTITYSYDVMVNTVPESKNYKNKAVSVFNWVMATGDQPTTGSADSNEVITVIDNQIDAIDDFATTEFGTPTIISVLNNDKYVNPADGSQILPTLSTENGKTAKNGTVEVLPSGQIKYTPNPGFSGVDSFVYEICDATNKCDTAIVTVNVLPDGQIAPIDNVPTILIPNTSTQSQTNPTEQGFSIPANLGATTNLAIRSGGNAVFWMVLTLLVVVLLSLGVTIIGAFDRDFDEN